MSASTKFITAFSSAPAAGRRVDVASAAGRLSCPAGRTALAAVPDAGALPDTGDWATGCACAAALVFAPELGT
jgi:hypothetical protein